MRYPFCDIKTRICILCVVAVMWLKIMFLIHVEDIHNLHIFVNRLQTQVSLIDRKIYMQTFRI